MNKLLIPACLLLTIAAWSCKDARPERAEAPVAALQPGELFQKQRVAGFLKENKGQDDSAATLFRKGVDAYRNNNNPEAAAKFFVESLCLAPGAPAYYELGNARLDLKDFTGALAAYDMAEQLGYEPLSKLLYNKACALSLSGDARNAVAFMQYAVEAGYTNSQHLLSDPDLATARQSDYFQTAYHSAMEGASEPEVLEWQSFKREFPVVALPLEIGLKTSAMKEGTDPAFIAYEFERFVPEMRSGKFSREVDKEYYYYARVSEAPAYTAVIYVIRDVMSGELAPECFVLATYDGRGALIDKLIVGGKEALSKPYRTATISPAMELTVGSHQQLYEQDVQDVGYYNNKVVGYKDLGTRRYRIHENGKILSASGKLTMR